MSEKKIERKILYQAKGLNTNVMPVFDNQGSLTVRATQYGEFKNIEITHWSPLIREFIKKDGKKGNMSPLTLSVASASQLIEELDKAVLAIDESQ